MRETYQANREKSIKSSTPCYMYDENIWDVIPQCVYNDTQNILTFERKQNMESSLYKHHAG